MHDKVNRLVAEGMDAAKIRNILLWEDDTFVKLKTLKEKNARV